MDAAAEAVTRHITGGARVKIPFLGASPYLGLLRRRGILALGVFLCLPPSVQAKSCSFQMAVLFMGSRMSS